MNPHYEFVAGRAGHRCEYCRAPEAVFNLPFEVEHIIPPGQGGSETAGNLALACRSCNVFKTNHTEFRDPETGRTHPLFHARLDSWDEHFRVDLQTGEIMGITPTGRATSECLRMNSESQVQARRQWVRIGVFP